MIKFQNKERRTASGANGWKKMFEISTDNKHNEPKWQEPVEYISIGVALGVIFTIFIYGGYLL